MALQFEWDGDKALSNQKKHEVTFEDATSIFLDRNSLTIDDTKHSAQEKRLVTLGQAVDGRFLVVVHTERGDRIRIISARRASKKERAQYHSLNEGH